MGMDGNASKVLAVTHTSTLPSHHAGDPGTDIAGDDGNRDSELGWHAAPQAALSNQASLSNQEAALWGGFLACCGTFEDFT